MPLTIEYQPPGESTALTSFTYDGNGRRVKKQGGSDTVIYVDETYEIRNGQPVKYIFGGGYQRLSRITSDAVQYYHKDHLGSSVLITDADGYLIESDVYKPYGLKRPTCAPQLGNVAYTFTDQEWDVLETRSLSHDFSGLSVLTDVNLQVRQGERHAIIGPNGAGKTTLFNIITGTYTPSQGKVYFKDKNTTGAGPCQIQRCGMGRSFQITSTFDPDDFSEHPAGRVVQKGDPFQFFPLGGQDGGRDA